MNSFVKPAARAKFGIAAASTAALVVSPLIAQPASADGVNYIDVTACADSGAGSLRAAITAANASAEIDIIDIVIEANCTVTVDSTMLVNDSMRIQKAAEDFYFTLERGAALTASLLQIEGPGSSLEYVQLGIDGITIDGNNVTANDPLVLSVSDGYVGGISLYNSNLIEGAAGAVAAGAGHFINVDNSLFYANFATAGAAILGYGSTVSVTDSSFLANSAADFGGAIALLGGGDLGYLQVTGSTFTENIARNGGAILARSLTEDPLYAGFDARVQISNSIFNSNDAIQFGGAIVAYQTSMTLWGFTDQSEGPTPTELLQNGNHFDGNMAPLGGAVTVIEGSMISAGNYFEGNEAMVYGGAVLSYAANYAADHKIISYFDSFHHNYADAGSAVGVLNTGAYLIGDYFAQNASEVGGAVFLRHTGLGIVANNNFVENHAELGTSALLVLDENDRSRGELAADLLGEQRVMLREAIKAEFGDIAPEGRQSSPTATATELALIHNTFYQNENGSGAEFNQTVGLGMPLESTFLLGNIFASSDASASQFRTVNPQIDAGANLVTGPAVAIGSGGLLPNYPGAVDGESVMVEWQDLDLQPPAVVNSNPENTSLFPVIALGKDSIALDYYNDESEGIHTEWFEDHSLPLLIRGFDSRLVSRVGNEGVPLYGSGFDAGAFELGWALDPAPIDPNIVITGVSKPTISATGDSFSVYGRGLDDVTELFVAGVKVSFRVVAANELVVTSGALPVGQAEILAIATDGRAVYQLGVGVVDEASYWTKNLGNGQAKLYAKNIVGQGKVQFFLNGKEIAWINAIDETDPKLRKANGAAYLVRTVDLVAGKNRIEIKVDGVRVRFTTYSR